MTPATIRGGLAAIALALAGCAGLRGRPSEPETGNEPFMDGDPRTTRIKTEPLDGERRRMTIENQCASGQQATTLTQFIYTTYRELHPYVARYPDAATDFPLKNYPCPQGEIFQLESPPNIDQFTATCRNERFKSILIGRCVPYQALSPSHHSRYDL